MSDRTDFYFRQKVTEAELDLAFELLERADRNLAADIGVFGIIGGAVPSPHSPVPDLSIDLTSAARAYDRLGQRIFFGTDQTVDCTADYTGIPTDVTDINQERWLGVFLRFHRKLSDLRTDGNSQQVYFRRDESFEIRVRQAQAAGIGDATKVALQPDELLLCDIHRRHGQSQILADDIDMARRQAFVFARGDAVEIVSGLWNILQPAVNSVQAALDAVDAEMSAHFSASARRHTAADIDYAPHGFIAANDVQSAVDELIDDLSSGSGTPGTARIGADAVPGTPHALPASNVDSQLSQLLAWLNQHVSAPVSAHNASAIAASPHSYIATTSVQAQLQEIVTALQSQTAGTAGANRIGAEPVGGAPHQLPTGTAASQLSKLVEFLNNHTNATSGTHHASAISVADASNNYSATETESALAEVASMFSAEHFRANQSSPGQHRTIHQPALGSGRVLLWESAGTGSAHARMRVYADDDAVWFAMNASWTGSEWTRDDSTAHAGGFRFSGSFFEFLHDPGGAATFVDWANTWRLPMADTINSGLEVTGTIREYGRLALYGTNSYSTARTIALGGGVTFRARFPSAPSSITIAPSNTSSNWQGQVSVWTSSRDGFGFYSYQNLTATAHAWWHGSYTAIA